MKEILRIYSKFRTKGNSLASEQSKLYNHFIVSLSAGIFWFAIFLFLVLLIEGLAYLSGISGSLIPGLREIHLTLCSPICLSTPEKFRRNLEQKSKNPS